MSIRTTVSLEKELFERLKRDAQERGVSFKESLNETLRAGLAYRQKLSEARPGFRVKPFAGGQPIPEGLTCREDLFKYFEGEEYR